MSRDLELERKQNAEATEFAMCLLMPEAILTEAFHKTEKAHPEVIVKRLAKAFVVPIPAMAARLINLGLMQP